MKRVIALVLTVVPLNRAAATLAERIDGGAWADYSEDERQDWRGHAAAALAAAPDCGCGHPAPCPECGPGYRYGDDGCRHTPAAAPDEREALARAFAEHHARKVVYAIDYEHADVALTALAARPTTPTPTVIEWGVRWNRTDDGSPVYVACDDRAEAEEMIYNDGEPWLPETNPTLVRRTVTAWTVADARPAEEGPDDR